MSDAPVHSQLSPSLATSFVLSVMALVYLRGWLRLRSTFPSVISAWRLVAFMGGVVVVWGTIGSPVAILDHQSLTMHMVKHLVLMTVAAPLLLVGAPVLPLVRGFPRSVIPGELLVARRTTRWFGCWITHPLFCWFAATATVIGWHLPVTFQLAMRFHWVHSMQDVCFLLAGLLFWWPILRPTPNVNGSRRWSMVLYLFLATLPCDILSAFLAFCNRVVYPSYLFTHQLFALSPLQDQECAGALMWVWVTFAYLTPTVVITMQILSPANLPAREPAQAAWHRLTNRPLNGSEVELL